MYQHQAAPTAAVHRRQPRGDPPAEVVSAGAVAVTAIDGRSSFQWTNRAPGIKVVAHHSIDATGNGSKATLSLRYEGLFGGLLARMTRGITNRYLAMEANGLKKRSENPYFRYVPGHGDTEARSQ